MTPNLRFGFFILAVVSVVACSCKPNPKDLKTSFGDPCEVTYGGETSFHGDEACYELFPVKTISGYWVLGFENSSLFQTRTDVASGENPAWLSIGSKAFEAKSPVAPSEDGVYEVVFIGRESDRVGHFGHLSGWSRGVLAERFVSVKPAPDLKKYALPPEPRPPPPLEPTSPESPNNRMQRSGSP
jgi:hypothetical protein